MSLKKNNLRNQKINNKRTNIGKTLLWLLLSVFVVANVYLSIDSATSGAEMSYLEDRERSLYEEKNSLSEQLLKTASLKQVEYQAAELGFNKSSSVVYLNTEESVAKLP